MLRLDVQNQEWTGPLGASTKFGKIMHDPFIPNLSLFISNGCYKEKKFKQLLKSRRDLADKLNSILPPSRLNVVM